MSRKTAVILFLVLAFGLVIAAILAMRKPVQDGSWSGDLTFTTTTPTLTLLPDAGWWNELPTPAGQQSSSLTPTP